MELINKYVFIFYQQVECKEWSIYKLGQGKNEYFGLASNRLALQHHDEKVQNRRNNQCAASGNHRAWCSDIYIALTRANTRILTGQVGIVPTIIIVIASSQPLWHFLRKLVGSVYCKIPICLLSICYNIYVLD